MTSILYSIVRFSGIIAMFIAWLFVVTPAIKFGVNHKSDTITTAITNNDSASKVINRGLIIGAMFKMIFLLYLIKRFSIPPYGLAPILYLTTYMATICLAFFTQVKYPIIHYLIALYIFIVGSFSLLFIGVSAKSFNQFPLYISVGATIVYFLGQIIIWKKYKFGIALMEIWGFVILTVWTVTMTFI